MSKLIILLVFFFLFFGFHIGFDFSSRDVTEITNLFSILSTIRH